MFNYEHSMLERIRNIRMLFARLRLKLKLSRVGFSTYPLIGLPGLRLGLWYTHFRYLVETEDKRKNKKQKVSTGEF